MSIALPVQEELPMTVTRSALTRRNALKATGAAAAMTALPLPYYARAQGTGWAKLKGQSIS